MMERLLIFISEKKQVPVFINMMNGISYQDKHITAVLDSEIDIAGMPVKENVTYKTFSDYETGGHNIKICAEDARVLIKNWGNLKVKENLSFNDLTLYKGVSLWQVYDNAALLYYFTDLIYFIKIVSMIIEVEKPQQVIVLGSKFNKVCPIFLNIAKQKNILTRFYNARRQITLRLPGAQNAFAKSRFFGAFEIVIYFPFAFYNFGIFLKNSFNTLYGKIYNFKINPYKDRLKKVLFFTTNKKQLDSVIPLVKELQKDTATSVLLVDWYGRYGNTLSVLKGDKLFHKVFDGYSTFGINKIIWRVNKIFLENWHLIEDSALFKESLKYDTILLWDTVKPYLKELFLRHFCKITGIYEAVERLFNIETPKIIIVTNEREFNARICAIAARRKKIRSIGLIREMFADLPDRDPPLYTDKEIVDGKYSYELLLKRGISPDKLIISANPRWDELFFKKEHPQKEAICDKLNINSDKKLIVLTTTFLSPYMRKEEYKKLIKNVCAALKGDFLCHLVIKLHPADNNGNLAYAVCRETGIENVTIIRDIDIFDLISASTLLITSYSTAGLEAIMMDKPVMAVNLSMVRPEMSPFVSAGVAVGVYKEEALAGALKDILENRQLQEKLKIARQRFIPEYIQNFDGRAARTIAGIIINLLREK